MKTRQNSLDSTWKRGKIPEINEAKFFRFNMKTQQNSANFFNFCASFAKFCPFTFLWTHGLHVIIRCRWKPRQPFGDDEIVRYRCGSDEVCRRRFCACSGGGGDYDDWRRWTSWLRFPVFKWRNWGRRRGQARGEGRTQSASSEDWDHPQAAGQRTLRKCSVGGTDRVEAEQHVQWHRHRLFTNRHAAGAKLQFTVLLVDVKDVKQ